MSLLPEIILFLLALALLGLDLFLPERWRALPAWICAAGAAAAAVLAVLGAGAAPEFATLSMDAIALYFRVLVLAGLSVTALLSLDSPAVARSGAYYALLLLSAIGLCLMAAASDLVMLALAIELAAIPLYVLAAFAQEDPRSAEAGLKYFLFGAVASAVMIYGFTWLYGLTGETGLREVALALAAGGTPLPLLLLAALLVLAGLAFKTSIVPFHFWAPDVYEGAPTPVAAFLSTASKAAGFAVLARIVLFLLPPAAAPAAAALLAALAAGTMTLGNLLALPQTNLKRLLAYSSIAHAGFILMGIVAGGSEGAAVAFFYLAAYLVTNLAAFGAVVVISRATGSDEMAGFSGLSHRSPGLALVLLIAFLSLAGMPPFAGYLAKFFVFAAAVKAGWIWLAAAGIANAILGLYYYLAVLKVVYLGPLPDGAQGGIRPSRSAMLALSLACAAVLAMGIFASPWLEAAFQAARALFIG